MTRNMREINEKCTYGIWEQKEQGTNLLSTYNFGVKATSINMHTLAPQGGAAVVCYLKTIRLPPTTANSASLLHCLGISPQFSST